MYEKLHLTFNQHIPLSDEDWALITERFHPVSYKKKDKLIDIDQISRHFYFINSGLLRLYGYKEGEEKTLFFFSENMIAGIVESYLEKSPSKLVLEALEDTEILAIHGKDLQELYKISPDLTRIGLLLTQYRVSYLMKFFSSFVLDTPEERYRKFMEEHPDLLLRVPQHLIASFLGITPVSLSRIRKRISK
ncbi:Crp/Fnr family transcriptional regulator [Bacteroidota bacterium]